ncbi:CHAT domain-containing protein [Pyxidicoccus trucidator]|uniref:CHAT domain-containing protein n=1 Tax=Pyxidicoccus trucidator TaxID=2709662 RepID=UPI0013DBD8F5|nr:CHAT domain-containing protein [Pyxidicoccus trucidator]
MSARDWLQIDIECVGAEIRARTTGSRSEQTEPRSFGPELAAEKLGLFAQQVQDAAARAQPLGDSLHQAQALHRALFCDDTQGVLLRLREAAQKRPLLLRLMLGRDASLQAFPWEALCEPDTTVGFLGNSADVLLARGVRSKEPWAPREVTGAVRILVIAPSEGSDLSGLRGALEERITAGEVEWLDPLVGPRARFSQISERMKRGPIPHVIHFIGHGTVNSEGVPLLRLADEDGEEKWTEVELLAQQLKEGFCRYLRLIVLEACEGARPGALASAAEWLVRSGADAVIAHLWPVKTDIARACSRTFYRSLTGAGSRRGDVALSLNEARRGVLDGFRHSAEAFSPVLYLRGSDSILFDFQVQHIAPPLPSASVPRADTPAPALHKLLLQPFSLVLGDRWKDEQGVMDGFSERLRQALVKKVGPIPTGLSLSALAQHYELHFEEQELDFEIQEVFGHTAALPLIDVLARKLTPGVHITLLRLPRLELALAEQRPELTLYVIHPPGPGGSQVTVLRREGGDTRWEKVRQLPEINPQQHVIVLRLYSGYLPPDKYMRPLLTEDDYLRGIRKLERMLPLDLADSLMGQLNMRPALIMGLSMLTWQHRILLYRLFGERPLPSGSLVVLEPGEAEQELWARGRIPSAREGVQTLELSATDMLRPLSAAAQEQV